MARRNTISQSGEAGSPIASGTVKAATVDSNDARANGTPARSGRSGGVRSTRALASST